MAKKVPPEFAVQIIEEMISNVDARYNTERVKVWEFKESEVEDIRRLCRGDKPQSKLGREARRTVIDAS